MSLTKEHMAKCLNDWAEHWVKRGEDRYNRLSANLTEEEIQRRINLAVMADRKRRENDDYGGGMGFPDATQSRDEFLERLKLDVKNASVELQNNRDIAEYIKQITAWLFINTCQSNLMNICYRVYNNFDKSAVESISDDELINWCFVNRISRPGCAQIVNDKVVYRGYLDSERLRVIDPTASDGIDGVDVKQAIEIMKMYDGVRISFGATKALNKIFPYHD